MASDTIKNAEEYIDKLRSEGRFEEADEEREFFQSLGFVVKNTTTGTKIIWPTIV